MKYGILGLLCWVVAAQADTRSEITHLLSFVQNTSCQYERNGKRHTGLEAVEHIQKKYRYFKDKISTTEDFIQLTATKSKLSGKFYLIHCENKAPVKSADWLLKELNRYRAFNS